MSLSSSSGHRHEDSNPIQIRKLDQNKKASELEGLLIKDKDVLPQGDSSEIIAEVN